MNLSIRPVNQENYEDIIKLRINEDQELFIESPLECLQEASQQKRWRPVGLYDDETLIGFAMYALFERKDGSGRVWLDRFLIDSRFQYQGYGKAAILLLIRRLVKEYACDHIYLSVYKDNKVAIALYQKLGFEFNGEKDINGEDVMVWSCSDSVPSELQTKI